MGSNWNGSVLGAAFPFLAVDPKGIPHTGLPLIGVILKIA
jgi:hypothetical protein